MPQVRVTLDEKLDEWLTKESESACRTKSRQIEWFLKRIHEGKLIITDGSLTLASNSNHVNNVDVLDKEKSTSIDTSNNNVNSVDDNDNYDSSYKSNEDYIEGLSSSDKKNIDDAANF